MGKEDWVIACVQPIPVKKTRGLACLCFSCHPSGGSKGGVRDARPPSASKFFQFHAVFWENLAKLRVHAPPLEGSRPPLGEILDPSLHPYPCLTIVMPLKIFLQVTQLLKGPGSFWVSNAQICILLHYRDSFSLILTASSTSKIVH